MVLEVVKVFGDIGKQIAKSIFPDPADKLKREQLASQIQSGLLQSQTDIIKSEAQGESWIQRNWRPVTMLTFVGLIVAKWLGLTAPGVTEAIEIELLEIIKVGLGGYVIGRSAEKAIKVWKKDA